MCVVFVESIALTAANNPCLHTTNPDALQGCIVRLQRTRLPLGRRRRVRHGLMQALLRSRSAAARLPAQRVHVMAALRVC